MRSERIAGRLGLGAVGGALAVVGAGNPVHSVLWLVLVFCQAAGLRLLLQAEFRALLFVVVYVGAIAVLFLFVVRRLNLPRARVREGRAGALPRVGARGLASFLGRGSVLRSDLAVRPAGWGPAGPGTLDWVGARDSLGSLESLGQRLYTHRFVYFLLAGYVLLVARVGAMVLTLQAPGTRPAPVLRQQLHQQLARDADRAVFRVR